MLVFSIFSSVQIEQSHLTGVIFSLGRHVNILVTVSDQHHRVVPDSLDLPYVSRTKWLQNIPYPDAV